MLFLLRPVLRVAERKTGEIGTFVVGKGAVVEV